MVVIKKLNESYLKLECNESIARGIGDYFSFYADNYRFNPKYKAGIWSGKIYIFNNRNNTLPIGSLNRLTKLLKSSGIEFKVDRELYKTNRVSEKEITDFIKTLDCRLEPRDYQIAGIQRALNEMKCGILLPTNSGKSFLQYAITKYLLSKNPNFKVLVIVPTIGLVSQMQYDFLDYSGQDKELEKDIHLIYGGKEKVSDKRIQISTWQSLQTVDIKEQYGEKGNLFQSFDVLLCDEVHGAAAKELNKIILNCTNAEYKIGMSGTLKEDSKVSMVQLESLFGTFEKSITTKELIERGYATDLKIKSIVLKYPKEEIKAYKEKVKELPSTDKKLKYQLEVSSTKSSKRRMNFVCNLITKLNGNTLVLFRHVEYGRLLAEKLHEMNPDRNIYLIYGKTDKDERERVRLSIEGDSDAIIIGSEAIMSTGVNIPKLNYLVLAQVTKSQIRILQSIGRLLRKHVSKSKVIIYDLVDYLDPKGFLVKHGIKRIDIYGKEEFNYEVKEIQL